MAEKSAFLEVVGTVVFLFFSPDADSPLACCPSSHILLRIHRGAGGGGVILNREEMEEPNAVSPFPDV